MTRTLYPFQEKCVQFHLEHKYSLNCSEMGCGKSSIALATAKRAGLDALVFGPAFLEQVWRNEAEIMGVKVRYIPYSVVHKLDPYLASAYKFWIADEAHMLKTPTANRTQAFHTLLEECRPDHFIGLTGTPIKNRAPDIWTLLAFCTMCPSGNYGAPLIGELRGYYGFSNYFCEKQEMRIGGKKIVKYRGLKAGKLEEFKSLLKDKMVRYRVSDVLSDLPPLTNIVVPVDISESVEGVRSTFEAYMAGGKYNIEAKLQSAVLKVPQTVVYCKSLLEGGAEPLLIFSDHIIPVGQIAKELKCPSITGITPAEDRAKIVAEFQAGQHQALVATIGSMSLGVTLTAARHVVFNDLSWVPADNLQAEKRIHRIGQKNATFVHHLDATTTDTYIRKTLAEKMKTIEEAVQ